MLSAYKDRFEGVLLPAAKAVADRGISPNALTIMGFATSVAAAIALAVGGLPYALLFLILASLLDALDGAVARVSNKMSKLGSYLDSVLDRYADGILLLGVMLYLGDHHALILLVLLGALLVSYSRSKAESLGMRGDVGIAERADRLLVFIIAIFLEFLGVEALYPALVVLAIATHVTVLQRGLHVRTSLENRG